MSYGSYCTIRFYIASCEITLRFMIHIAQFDFIVCPEKHGVQNNNIAPYGFILGNVNLYASYDFILQNMTSSCVIRSDIESYDFTVCPVF